MIRCKLCVALRFGVVALQHEAQSVQNETQLLLAWGLDAQRSNETKQTKKNAHYSHQFSVQHAIKRVYLALVRQPVLK